MKFHSIEYTLCIRCGTLMYSNICSVCGYVTKGKSR